MTMEEMAMNQGLIGVFALAIIELWAAIPLGLHLKLPPLLLIAAATTGALIGSSAAIYLGNGMRRLLFWRKPEKTKDSRLSRWLAAKGPWAIGLLGPVLIGPVLSAILAGTIGLPRAFTLALLGLGILVWTITFSLLGASGMAVLR
jgi:membrane protein YqaA with SNARE-associated domain